MPDDAASPALGIALGTMPDLLIVSSGWAGQRCSLPDGRFPVGQSRENDIVIAEATVSARHCELLGGGCEVIVRDAGSRNGTFVSDKEVQAQAGVRHGQRLRLGGVERLPVFFVPDPSTGPSLAS